MFVSGCHLFVLLGIAYFNSGTLLNRVALAWRCCSSAPIRSSFRMSIAALLVCQDICSSQYGKCQCDLPFHANYVSELDKVGLALPLKPASHDAVRGYLLVARVRRLEWDYCGVYATLKTREVVSVLVDGVDGSRWTGRV